MTVSKVDDGRENDFTGIESMAEMLTRNTSLTNLNLFKSFLGMEGGRALSAALKKNQSLIILGEWRSRN